MASRGGFCARAKRHGRSHRERFVRRGAIWLAGRIHRLRREQGRGGYAYHRARSGGRGRGHFIYTDLHAKGGEPDRVERVKALVPMQRGGQPEEVAAAILWLLSGEASYITGTIIDVSGGH